MSSLEHELIETALPYWETEAALVRRVFARKPSRVDHIFWQGAVVEGIPSGGRYFTGLQKELNELAARFPEIGKTNRAAQISRAARAAYAGIQPPLEAVGVNGPGTSGELANAPFKTFTPLNRCAQFTVERSRFHTLQGFRCSKRSIKARPDRSKRLNHGNFGMIPFCRCRLRYRPACCSFGFR